MNIEFCISFLKGMSYRFITHGVKYFKTISCDVDVCGLLKMKIQNVMVPKIRTLHKINIKKKNMLYLDLCLLLHYMLRQCGIP